MSDRKKRSKPDWLRMPTMGAEGAAEVRSILRKHDLETVCSQARCPNMGHCYQRGTATFLILGSVCTRTCGYCAIEHSACPPPPPDPDEPARVAGAAAEMGLSYVVVTSVTRDDLPDGGAGHFAKTVSEIRKLLPEAMIEVLTPDFRGAETSLQIISDASPDVFNHNLETVRALFPAVRPEASYDLSLEVLRKYGRMSPSTPLKSGLMVGLGEEIEDIRKAITDLREAGVTMLTLGQYLQPTSEHLAVDRFVHPREFDEWKAFAESIGFRSVASGPLVRSSFHADLSFPASDGAHGGLSE